LQNILNSGIGKVAKTVYNLCQVILKCVPSYW